MPTISSLGQMGAAISLYWKPSSVRRMWLRVGDHAEYRPVSIWPFRRWSVWHATPMHCLRMPRWLGEIPTPGPGNTRRHWKWLKSLAVRSFSFPMSIHWWCLLKEASAQARQMRVLLQNPCIMWSWMSCIVEALGDWFRPVDMSLQLPSRMRPFDAIP